MRLSVTISLAVGMSEDVSCIQFEVEAKSHQEAFDAITSNKWFCIPNTLKNGEKEYQTQHHIQVRHITDIYIREVIE